MLWRPLRSKTEFFAKIVNGLKQLIISQKVSILFVRGLYKIFWVNAKRGKNILRLFSAFLVLSGLRMNELK